jgi:hypothetical protein
LRSNNINQYCIWYVNFIAIYENNLHNIINQPKEYLVAIYYTTGTVLSFWDMNLKRYDPCLQGIYDAMREPKVLRESEVTTLCIEKTKSL